MRKLISNIRRKCNFINDNEVDLFRSMAKELLKRSKGVFIDETHGKVCNVTFNSIRGVTEQCEISDLLIITVDKKKNFARATFWQAKKETSPKWIINATTPSHNNCFDFKGQFDQWELLSYRHDINGVAKFKPPKKLLSSFNSPSIGSYGVFYEEAKMLELNYSVAEFVTSTTLPPVRKYSKSKPQSRMVINGKLSKYTYGLDEKIVCNNILDFLTALTQNQIGARIETTKPEHSWLIGSIKSQINSSKNIIYGNNSKEFDKTFFPDVPGSNVDDPPEGLSILILESSQDFDFEV